MCIDQARHLRHALLNLTRQRPIPVPVASLDLHVDLRGDAEIQDLGDHIGGLEIEQYVGKGLGEREAQLLDVVRRRRMALLQGDQDLAVVDADGRSIGEGEVIGALRQPDIVQDEIQVALGHDLPDLVLDRLEDLLGMLDARARRRTDMELDEPGVDLGEEIGADLKRQHHRPGDDGQGDGGHDDAPVQDAVQQPDIAIAQMIEASVEPIVEAVQRTTDPSHMTSLLPAQEQADDDGRQGARDHIGGDHGEDHGHAERSEEISGRSLQEEDRDEDAADRQGRDQGRQGDLGGAMKDRLVEGHLLLEQAVGILDGHCGIVDQYAHGKGEAAQASWY